MEKEHLFEDIDFIYQLKILKKAKQCLLMLNFLNIITFGIFKKRLNYQAEIIIELLIKSF